MYSQTYGKQQATKTAKLKFFCQMCRKQCYDENGFRCHLNSGHHMKMMRQYNEDPEFYIAQFSDEFEKAFMDMLKEKYKDQKIGSTKIYEEMIRKVDHVHLNGTKWTKLTDFIQYLIQNKKVGFDHSQGDIVIWNLDNKSEKVKFDKVEVKKAKVIEKATNPLIDKSVEQQLIKGQQLNQVENTEGQIERQEGEKQVIENECFVSFGINFKQEKKSGKQEQEENEKQEKKVWVEETLHKQAQNLEKLYQNIKYKNDQNPNSTIEQTQVKETQEDFAWLKENIIVKIVDQKLNSGKFFGKKGVVKRIVEQYGGFIEVQSANKEKILVDQKFLQTVIPKIGSQVMVLKQGDHCGKIGKLESIHQDNYSGSVYVENENILLEIPFDLFSKINCE